MEVRAIMDELQISRLPSNFYVYKMRDFQLLNCKKEAEDLLDIINLSKKREMCKVISNIIKSGLFQYL